MWNFLRSTYYLLTFRPSKAFNLPLTEADIVNSKYIRVVFKPMANLKDIQKEFDIVFGKNGCRTLYGINTLDESTNKLLSEDIHRVVSYSDFQKFVQKSWEDSGGHVGCCWYEPRSSITGTVFGLDLERTKSFKSIYVDVLDDRSPALRDLARCLSVRLFKAVKCPSCSNLMTLTTTEGSCTSWRCSYVGQELLVIPRLLTRVESFKDFITEVRKVEKSSDMKLVKDHNVFVTGFTSSDPFSNDEDDGE